MNIALEQTEEHVNGNVTNRYGDAFIRGNNGAYTVSRRWYGFSVVPSFPGVAGVYRSLSSHGLYAPPPLSCVPIHPTSFALHHAMNHY